MDSKNLIPNILTIYKYCNKLQFKPGFSITYIYNIGQQKDKCDFYIHFFIFEQEIL